MADQKSYLKQIQKSLDDIQATDIVVIDVREHTSVTDYMIISTGRSSRHVKAIADTVIEEMKKQGLTTLSLTGLEGCEWVLIDFGDFVLHVMQPDSRAFYNLEGLWQSPHPG